MCICACAFVRVHWCVCVVSALVGVCGVCVALHWCVCVCGKCIGVCGMCALVCVYGGALVLCHMSIGVSPFQLIVTATYEVAVKSARLSLEDKDQGVKVKTVRYSPGDAWVLAGLSRGVFQ